MTTAQIADLQKLANMKYAAAQQIRVILDKVREAHGDEAYDAGDIEDEIIEMVTG